MDGTFLPKKTLGIGGFRLNQLDRIFAEDRLTKVGDNEFDQIIKGGDFH